MQTTSDSDSIADAEIAPTIVRYRAVGAADHGVERLTILGMLDKLEFDALSIGNRKGQIALVPLDESSRKNAELIVRLWNEYHRKRAAETD